jgi:hypothetical protein
LTTSWYIPSTLAGADVLVLFPKYFYNSIK